MKRFITFSKIMDFSGSDIIGNILDNSTQYITKVVCLLFYLKLSVTFLQVFCHVYFWQELQTFRISKSQIVSRIGLRILYSITSSYLEVGENAVLFVSESSSIHGEVLYAHLDGDSRKISNKQKSILLKMQTLKLQNSDFQNCSEFWIIIRIIHIVLTSSESNKSFY